MEEGGTLLLQTGVVREELWRTARRRVAVRALGILDRGFKALRRVFDATGQIESDCTAHMQVCTKKFGPSLCYLYILSQYRAEKGSLL
jgi:hypothetical protein